MKHDGTKKSSIVHVSELLTKLEHPKMPLKKNLNKKVNVIILEETKDSLPPYSMYSRPHSLLSGPSIPQNNEVTSGLNPLREVGSVPARFLDTPLERAKKILGDSHILLDFRVYIRSVGNSLVFTFIPNPGHCGARGFTENSGAALLEEVFVFILFSTGVFCPQGTKLLFLRNVFLSILYNEISVLFPENADSTYFFYVSFFGTILDNPNFETPYVSRSVQQTGELGGCEIAGHPLDILIRALPTYYTVYGRVVTPEVAPRAFKSMEKIGVVQDKENKTFIYATYEIQLPRNVGELASAPETPLLQNLKFFLFVHKKKFLKLEEYFFSGIRHAILIEKTPKDAISEAFFFIPTESLNAFLYTDFFFLFIKLDNCESLLFLASFPGLGNKSSHFVSAKKDMPSFLKNYQIIRSSGRILTTEDIKQFYCALRAYFNKHGLLFSICLVFLSELERCSINLAASFTGALYHYSKVIDYKVTNVFFFYFGLNQLSANDLNALQTLLSPLEALASLNEEKFSFDAYFSNGSFYPGANSSYTLGNNIILRSLVQPALAVKAPIFTNTSVVSLFSSQNIESFFIALAVCQGGKESFHGEGGKKKSLGCLEKFLVLREKELPFFLSDHFFKAGHLESGGTFLNSFFSDTRTKFEPKGSYTRISSFFGHLIIIIMTWGFDYKSRDENKWDFIVPKFHSFWPFSAIRFSFSNSLFVYPELFANIPDFFSFFYPFNIRIYAHNRKFSWLSFHLIDIHLFYDFVFGVGTGSFSKLCMPPRILKSLKLMKNPEGFSTLFVHLKQALLQSHMTQFFNSFSLWEPKLLVNFNKSNPFPTIFIGMSSCHFQVLGLITCDSKLIYNTNAIRRTILRNGLPVVDKQDPVYFDFYKPFVTLLILEYPNEKEKIIRDLAKKACRVVLHSKNPRLSLRVFLWQNVGPESFQRSFVSTPASPKSFVASRRRKLAKFCVRFCALLDSKTGNQLVKYRSFIYTLIGTIASEGTVVLENPFNSSATSLTFNNKFLNTKSSDAFSKFIRFGSAQSFDQVRLRVPVPRTYVDSKLPLYKQHSFISKVVLSFYESSLLEAAKTSFDSAQNNKGISTFHRVSDGGTLGYQYFDMFSYHYRIASVVFVRYFNNESLKKGSIFFGRSNFFSSDPKTHIHNVHDMFNVCEVERAKFKSFDSPTSSFTRFWSLFWGYSSKVER